MKIGSFNIRGLGSWAKKDELMGLFLHHYLSLCCVQETKVVNFNDREEASIWKQRGFKWCAEGANGRSGGILTFWDEKKFSCSSCWGIGGAVVVNGRDRESGLEVCVINIYASCDFRERSLLWDIISMVVRQREEMCTCVFGDFNSILLEGERVGVGEGNSSRERRAFLDFIGSCNLIDVALQGREFTWYNSGGTCKSRLDRALVNEEWAVRWQDTVLHGLPRSVSDHCALVLATKSGDWGPRPFRFINAWKNDPGFMENVGDSWREGGIEGWGCFVLKEKLKRLKGVLKTWNSNQFGHLEGKVRELREELSELDRRDDNGGLNEIEALRRKEVMAKLILQLKNWKSLLAQKAKIKWLKEGDTNSRTFHRVLNRERCRNRITGLEIEGG